jgi:hypothetical protein
VCVCVLALVIRHEKLVRHVILSCVACLALSIFPRHLMNYTIFRKKKLLNIKCVFWFSLQLLSETFLVLRKTHLDINMYWSSCTIPVIRVRFLWGLDYLDKFFEKYSNVKLNENPSSGSRVVPCWRADRWDEVNSSFFAILHMRLKDTNLCSEIFFSMNCITWLEMGVVLGACR